MHNFTWRVLLVVLTAAISWSTACLSDAREVQSLDGTWDIVFDLSLLKTPSALSYNDLRRLGRSSSQKKRR
jgi:hypothetical protein